MATPWQHHGTGGAGSRTAILQHIWCQDQYCSTTAHLLFGSRNISKQIITVFAKFGHVTCAPAPGEEDRQCRVVHQHLPAQGLRGTSSKQRHPRPAAPPRQRMCPHRRRHSGLPGSRLRSAGHPDHVFLGLCSWWFLSIPSSEAAVEGGVATGRDLWHA